MNSIYNKTVFFVFALALCGVAQAKDSFKIVANSHYSSGYWQQLVKATLEETVKDFGEYEMIVHQEFIGNQRHDTEVKLGTFINVRIGVSTAEREDAYIPIKVPLRKGLINYRLLVVNKNDVDRFTKARTAEDLKAFKFGLVESWITTDIFKRNNMNVVPVVDPTRMLTMLERQRYDATVRGTNEVYTELATFDKNGNKFAIVPGVGIYINSPTYIFVSKKAPGLAKRLDVGLRRLIANGRFDEMFYKWHKESIERAEIDKRIFIKIDNPVLPDELIPKQKELWLPRIAEHL